jgi:3-oxoacyl-[acyl-carrier protein] reductase
MFAPAWRRVIRQGRLGEIEEFGFACAWMCSAHSGYLTGQNILIDGGSFNSTL